MVDKLLKTKSGLALLCSVILSLIQLMKILIIKRHADTHAKLKCALAHAWTTSHNGNGRTCICLADVVKEKRHYDRTVV